MTGWQASAPVIGVTWGPLTGLDGGVETPVLTCVLLGLTSGKWIGAGVGDEVVLGDVVVEPVVDFDDGVVVLSVVIGTLSVVMGTLSLPFLVTSMGFRGPTLSVSVLFEFTAELTEFCSWLVAGVAILGIFWLFLGLNHPGNLGGPLGPFLLSLLALRQA